MPVGFFDNADEDAYARDTTVEDEQQRKLECGDTFSADVHSGWMWLRFLPSDRAEKSCKRFKSLQSQFLSLWRCLRVGLRTLTWNEMLQLLMSRCAVTLALICSCQAKDLLPRVPCHCLSASDVNFQSSFA